MQQDTSSAIPALPLTGRLRRFACMMYEGVLLFGVVFLAGYIFDTLTHSDNALTLRHTRQAVLFAAIGVYFVLSWHRRGQTLPMKTWHIRLVDRTGAPPSLLRLIGRYVLVWPLPLAVALALYLTARRSGYPFIDLLVVFTPFSHFVWSWLDPQKQFLHDRLLGTRLIDSRRLTSTIPAS